MVQKQEEFDNFATSFRLAAEAVTSLATDALARLKGKFTDEDQMSKDDARVLYFVMTHIAAAVVEQKFRRQVATYVSRDPAKLIKKYGPDGKAALIKMIEEAGITATASPTDKTLTKELKDIGRRVTVDKNDILAYRECRNFAIDLVVGELQKLRRLSL